MQQLTTAEALADLRIHGAQVKAMIDELLASSGNLAMTALIRGDSMYRAKVSELTQSLVVATSLAEMLDPTVDFKTLVKGAALSAGDKGLAAFGVQMLDWMAACKGSIGPDVAETMYAERIAIIREEM